MVKERKPFELKIPSIKAEPTDNHSSTYKHSNGTSSAGSPLNCDGFENNAYGPVSSLDKTNFIIDFKTEQTSDEDTYPLQSTSSFPEDFPSSNTETGIKLFDPVIRTSKSGAHDSFCIINAENQTIGTDTVSDGSVIPFKHEGRTGAEYTEKIKSSPIFGLEIRTLKTESGVQGAGNQLVGTDTVCDNTVPSVKLEGKSDTENDQRTGIQFSHSNGQQEVEDTDTKDRKFQCAECPSAFPNLSRLKRHQLSHDQNSDRPFSCKTCGSQFKMRCHLKQHSLIHSGERPFACDKCDATFARSDHLKQHVQVHLGLKPYLCTVCNWAFTQACHLRKHMVRHRDDRVVCCKIKSCKAIFNSVSELQRHRKMHVEDRRCKVCNVLLSRTDDMKKHMRIHTKEKPFACLRCPARFTQLAHLSTHSLQHSGEKPFSCEKCGSMFAQACHLKRHMDVHEGDRPFSCEVCSASFKRQSSLTRHKRKCQKVT